jgi:adhesin/invasin
MYIAPEPGFLNPARALKNMLHQKGILSMMVLLLLCVTGLQAKTMPPGVPDLTHPKTRLYILFSGTIADNISANRVYAEIYDSDGNPVPNVNVNFFYNPGTGEVNTPISTNAEGKAYFQLSTSVVGSMEITAKVNGVPLEGVNPITVVFTANIPDAGLITTYLSMGNDGVKANGSSTNCVKAHIANANGYPVPNEPVTFYVASGTASPSGGVTTLNTDALGNVTMCYTSTVVGSADITATVRGASIVNGRPQL